MDRGPGVDLIEVVRPAANHGIKLGRENVVYRDDFLSAVVPHLETDGLIIAVGEDLDQAAGLVGIDRHGRLASQLFGSLHIHKSAQDVSIGRVLVVDQHSGHHAHAAAQDGRDSPGIREGWLGCIDLIQVGRPASHRAVDHRAQGLGTHVDRLGIGIPHLEGDGLATGLGIDLQEASGHSVVDQDGSLAPQVFRAVDAHKSRQDVSPFSSAAVDAHLGHHAHTGAQNGGGAPGIRVEGNAHVNLIEV